MKMTPKEAADFVGVSKSTVIRAIKGGKLSATKNDEGVNLIDPGELDRWNETRSGSSKKPSAMADTVEPERTPYHDTRRNTPKTQDDTPNDTGEARVLSVKVEMLQAQIDLLMSERDDLRKQRDDAQTKRNEAEARLTGLLTDQRADTEKAPEASRRRRWWQLAIIL